LKKKETKKKQDTESKTTKKVSSEFSRCKKDPQKGNQKRPAKRKPKKTREKETKKDREKESRKGSPKKKRTDFRYSGAGVVSIASPKI
jgi:hypothetical protein